MGKCGRQTLFCVHGSVWVTQECDIRDYVLEEGEAFIVTLSGLVMVRALRKVNTGYSESQVPKHCKMCFSQSVFK